MSSAEATIAKTLRPRQRQAFRQDPFEALRLCRLLHAYVSMSNHYQEGQTRGQCA